MNLWITVDKEGQYLATGQGQPLVLGSLKLALRAVTKLVTDLEVERLVFVSSTELRKWKRVENPLVEVSHKRLLGVLKTRGIPLLLVPGLAKSAGWEPVAYEPPAASPPKSSAAKSKTSRRHVYTDGSCLGNPGFGGWGWWSKDGHGSGSAPNSTNNQMEMSALLNALIWYRENDPDRPLKIISDSRYVLDGASKWIIKWKRRNWENVKNADLWQKIARELAMADVEFAWVKGHSGVPGNERADKLAGDAAAALKQKSR